MKQYRLAEQDRKQIAHFVAQRYASSVGELETKRAIDKYIEAYNSAMEQIIEYNNNAKD